MWQWKGVHMARERGGCLKKVGIVFLVLILLGVIAGGSGSSDKKKDSNKEEKQVEQVADSNKKEKSSKEEASDNSKEEEAPAKEETEPEPEPEPEEEGPSIAKNAKYSVTINGYRIVEDYDGAPCIAIDYTFTNVSDDSATSMQLATDITVYQDGVECEDAYFADANSDGYSNKVKAGVSVDVTRAYKLQNTSSNVEVEVGQLFSWNDDLLAYEVFQIA